MSTNKRRRRPSPQPARRAYLDTNVVFNLAELAMLTETAELWHQEEVDVVVGVALVGDLLSPYHAHRRRRVVDLLKTISAKWPPDPPGWTHSRELYRLIRRTHPDWIKGRRRKALHDDLLR